MVIFDESNNVITDPDLEAGHLEYETINVTHSWVVDSPEEGEIVVIAEYPNGGKDTEWQVTKPEEGHFDTKDEDGNEVEHFDGIIPDDLPHDVPNPDSWTFARYILYTEEALAQRAAEQAEFQRQDDISTQMNSFVSMMVMPMSINLADEQALEIPLLFDEWAVDIFYKKDRIIRHNDELYRIGQDHTSQAQWVPGETGTTALYSHIEIGGDNYEVWKEWDGVSGIYQQGQIVHDPYDDNNLYKSKIPNNVWGPPHEQPAYWDPYTE